MSRVNVGDREFGKGRNNDDSSSPESSPRQTTKRSFSPTSDDGDLVIPPIADDDTPPPPERPLIRQAVGFPTATMAISSGLNTYEVVKSSTSESLFLPGQVPSAPSQRKKRQTDGPPRKKKKTTDYGGQTNRFRLNPHVGAVLSEPSVLQSPSSTATFRANSATPTVSTSPTPTTVSYTREPTTLQLPVIEAIPQIKQSARWKVAKPSLDAAEHGKLPVISTHPSPQSSRSLAKTTAPQDRGSSHYRRDYEKDSDFHQPEVRHPSTSHGSGLPSGASSAYETNRSASRTTGNSSLSSVHANNEDRTKEGRRTQKTPLLMLTLLIQDIRSGVTDHQLAEVKVPMKAANDPRDGFWADAKILGQQLQSSASRIDGPAKVYTLRGKYRQFFLRVSAENRDEYISTHLAIKPDRMLDVVVEELLPPGQLPQPPRIPRDLIARSVSPDSSSGSPSPERDFNPLASQRGKKYESHFDQNYHQESSRRSLSPDLSERRCNSRKGRTQQNAQLPGRRSGSPTGSTSAELLTNGIKVKSPVSGDPPEEIQRLIVDAVDVIIQEQEEDQWEAFFQAKGALEPHRSMDVLAQYHIIKHMLDKFVGKKLPFRSFKANIEKEHIIQALKIEDPNFASACLETLGLLDLYGENGRHYEDPRVIAMVKDESTPEYNAKPIKRLLHLMREIDLKWKEEHPLVETSSG